MKKIRLHRGLRHYWQIKVTNPALTRRCVSVVVSLSYNTLAVMLFCCSLPPSALALHALTPFSPFRCAVSTPRPPAAAVTKHFTCLCYADLGFVAKLEIVVVSLVVCFAQKTVNKKKN
jgi:hypothetical protein